jgi:hypothetical protein
MYTSTDRRWEFAFSSRDDDHVAVVSLARMAQAHPMLIRARADTMVVREVGILHFHDPLAKDIDIDIDWISTATSYR